MSVDKIFAVLCEKLGYESDEIKPSDTWDDLGADNLDQVEILIELEDQFNLEISDDAFNACETVGDLVRMIEGMLPKSDANDFEGAKA